MNDSSIANLRVLVVDDDPIARLVHQKIVEQQGHHVVQAENGEQAVALAKNQVFDAILMDVNMPGLDGLDASERIRAEEQNQHRNFIIGITGQIDTAYSEYLAKGMNEILGKPIQPEQLLCVLKKIERGN
jgi:CheY-like chemotaxis protein